MTARIPNEFLRADDPDIAKVERHRARYARAIELADIDGGLWLDCACGSGYGTKMVAEAGADVTWGVDRNLSTINVLQANELWVSKRAATFMRRDIEDAENWMLGVKFDGILCVETLEHLAWPDQKNWVASCAKHLVPGGVLVIACPVGRGGPNPHNPWHLYEPTVDDLATLLRQFAAVTYHMDEYTDTSGHDAKQAFVVARFPTVRLSNV